GLLRVVVSHVVAFRTGVRVISLLGALPICARGMVAIRWGRLHRGVFAGCVAWMGAAVIGELGAGRFASVNLATARVSSIGRGRRAGGVQLCAPKTRVVRRRLQPGVVNDVVD